MSKQRAYELTIVRREANFDRACCEAEARAKGELGEYDDGPVKVSFVRYYVTHSPVGSTYCYVFEVEVGGFAEGV